MSEGVQDETLKSIWSLTENKIITLPLMQVKLLPVLITGITLP